MTYELGFFDQFIHQYLTSLHPKCNEVPKYEQLKNQLNKEAAAVKSRMVAHVFAFKKQCEIEIYIQHHQSALIALSDSLLQFINHQQVFLIYKVSRSHCFMNLCKVCYKAIEEILLFVETYFSNYFDKNVKLPELRRLIAVNELEEKLSVISEALVKGGVRSELLNITLKPIHKFLERSGEKDVSYSRLIWINELVRELSLLNTEGNRKLNHDVFNVLCYLNNNSYGFFRYCVRRCRKELERERDHKGKTERLRWLVKITRQYSQKPGFRLCRERPSLKKQISSWLYEELEYLNINERFSQEVLVPLAQPAVKNRVKASVSVAHLAYMLRLQVECGIFKTESLSELFKFYAFHMTSLRSEHISAESLRTRYYNVERATSDSVRDLLLKMVHYSKKVNP